MSETTFPRSAVLWWDNSVIPPVLRVELIEARVPPDIPRAAYYVYTAMARDRERP